MLRLAALQSARLTSIALAAAVLHGCNGAGETQSSPAVIRDTSPVIKISSQYNDFEHEADSTLCRLDSLLTMVDIQMVNVGRRRHMAQQRRHFINAQYRLDKLREKLKEHSDAYRAAVQHLNRTEHDNPAFIRDYRAAMRELDSTVAALSNETSP